MRYALVTASPLLEINTQIDASNLIAGLGNEFVMPYVHPNVHFTIISKENYNEIKIGYSSVQHPLPHQFPSGEQNRKRTVDYRMNQSLHKDTPDCLRDGYSANHCGVVAKQTAINTTVCVNKDTPDYPKGIQCREWPKVSVTNAPSWIRDTRLSDLIRDIAHHCGPEALHSVSGDIAQCRPQETPNYLSRLEDTPDFLSCNIKHRGEKDTPD
ncbi:hypothetical protein RRG08_006010 [Elysia crispata]|uniref:Uncharacterized protein n=1 Tax=Elysia crispata TaxID=231223 RepID=A0AAE0XVI1_9GAST|nr:hypothetical protein RRG08_006010 [Elysia crispata]